MPAVQSLGPHLLFNLAVAPEMVDVRRQLRHPFLLGKRVSATVRARPSTQQQVLIVEVRRQVEYVEPTGAEEGGQRSQGEVRAVLVVDVPECELSEDPTRVGHLEEHG